MHIILLLLKTYQHVWGAGRVLHKLKLLLSCFYSQWIFQAYYIFVTTKAMHIYYKENFEIVEKYKGK
jgi:hypothetical protein